MEFNLTPSQWNSAQLNSTEHLRNGIHSTQLTPLQWNSVQLNSTEHLCNAIQFNSTQLNLTPL
jgi:hypothetical protein